MKAKGGVRMNNLEWEKLKRYPRKGDYVKVEWNGRTYEGKVIGDKPIKFETGFVAREVFTESGDHGWIPWSKKCEYYKRRKKIEKTLWLLVVPDVPCWDEEFAKKALNRLAKKWNVEIVETKENRNTGFGEERKFILVGEEENVLSLEDELADGFH